MRPLPLIFLSAAIAAASPAPAAAAFVLQLDRVSSSGSNLTYAYSQFPGTGPIAVGEVLTISGVGGFQFAQVSPGFSLAQSATSSGETLAITFNGPSQPAGDLLFLTSSIGTVGPLATQDSGGPSGTLIGPATPPPAGPGPVAVPEPPTLGLTLLGLALWIIRRRAV